MGWLRVGCGWERGWIVGRDGSMARWVGKKG